MKKTTILVFTIAFAFALSGCLSENETSEREIYRDISLRIAQTSAARSTGNDDVALRSSVPSLPLYGISRPIPNREPLVLAHGDLFLVAADGVIMRHIRINTGNAALNNTTHTVGAEYLRNNGITIPSVPGSVTRVVIIGNYNGAEPLPTTGNINSDRFLTRTLNVVNQYNAWSVNLTNCPATQIDTGARQRPNGNLLRLLNNGAPVYNNNVPVYTTTVHLAPTVARFEIAQIAGTGRIQSFTIDGIFMDNFYRQARINSELITASLHTGEDNPNNFTATSHNTANSILHDNRFGIHDWRTATTRHLNWTGNAAGSLVVRPDNVTTNVYHPARAAGDRWQMRDNVWAYQVFARDYHTAPAANAGTRVPRIIVRLSNVRIMDGTPNGALWNDDGIAFLTVRDFYFFNETNQRLRLQNIRASHVYHIHRITFTEDCLDYIPNRSAIDVEVEINLAAWRRVYLDIII